MQNVNFKRTNVEFQIIHNSWLGSCNNNSFFFLLFLFVYFPNFVILELHHLGHHLFGVFDPPSKLRGLGMLSKTIWAKRLSNVESRRGRREKTTKDHFDDTSKIPVRSQKCYKEFEESQPDCHKNHSQISSLDPSKNHGHSTCKGGVLVVVSPTITP